MEDIVLVGFGKHGKSDIREKLYNKLKAIGYNLPVIIDSSAVVLENVKNV